MNAASLAQAARDSVKPYASILSGAITAQLEQAYIARWLMQQDESVLSAAAVTATAALSLLAA